MQKIEGNDIASRLAKQRTEEAEGMPELTEAITLIDEKIAIRESWLEKWRQMLGHCYTGRHLFEYLESVRLLTSRYKR